MSANDGVEMKRVVVRLECVLELPDHVRLEEPAQGCGEMLLLHGRFLEPDLSWMAVEEIGEEEGSMTQVSLPEKLEDELRGSVAEVLVSDIEIQEVG
jgi:hypothetical protein